MNEEQMKTLFKSEIEEIRGTLKFMGKKLHEIDEKLTRIEAKEMREVAIQFQLIDKTPAPLTKENIELFESSLDLLLNCLTQQQKIVLIHRYGLKGETIKTLEQIASLGKRGLKSRERVRQIQSKALRDCRHPCRADFVKNLPFSNLKKDITGEE